MNRILGLLVPALVGLVVGLGGGYVLGRGGRQELAAELEKVKRNALEAGAACEAERRTCTTRLGEANGTRDLQNGRVQLLKAQLELTDSNFGLSSQHLAGARLALKKAETQIPGEGAAALKGLQAKLEEAQTQAMQLKREARQTIADILSQLERLPYGR